MSGPEICPHCGHSRSPGGDGALSSLHREIERIQDIASERVATEERRRIEELTQEVHQLREMVARLRGSNAAFVRHGG